MVYGKYKGSWIETSSYYSRLVFSIFILFFSILFFVLCFYRINIRALTATATGFNILFFGLAIIFLVFFVFTGIYTPNPSREVVKGARTILAKLFENVYLGYTAPFGWARYQINFEDKPTILVLKLKYIQIGPNFYSSSQPWAGWELLFLKNEAVWGPNMSLLQKNVREHMFFNNILGVARKHNLDIRYKLIDPQYLDVFLEELNKALNHSDPSKALEETGLKEDGTLPVEIPSYEHPPESLEMAKITPSYEELYPLFI